MSLPSLSICVPSRNRQVYFQETIRVPTASLRTDVELVLADNSDNGAVMDDFMADRLGDPRIRYLPASGTVLPMMDNWERALCRPHRRRHSSRSGTCRLHPQPRTGDPARFRTRLHSRLHHRL